MESNGIVRETVTGQDEVGTSASTLSPALSGISRRMTPNAKDLTLLMDTNSSSIDTITSGMSAGSQDDSDRKQAAVEASEVSVSIFSQRSRPSVSVCCFHHRQRDRYKDRESDIAHVYTGANARKGKVHDNVVDVDEDSLKLPTTTFGKCYTT
jgi:hypothetical protein